MDEEKKELLKRVLTFLESSGGVNTNHKPMQSGIHANTTAVGELGLMLNTAKEVANRKRLSKQADEKDLELLNNINSQEQFEQFLQNNPNKYEDYTNQLIDRVYTRSEGDIPTAATMWRWGHNLPSEKAKEILEKNPAYKQRILNALQRLKEK